MPPLLPIDVLDHFLHAMLGQPHVDHRTARPHLEQLCPLVTGGARPFARKDESAIGSSGESIDWQTVGDAMVMEPVKVLTASTSAARDMNLASVSKLAAPTANGPKTGDPGRPRKVTIA
jgi:hypothetical protein